MLKIAICDDDFSYAKWLEGKLMELCNGGVKIYRYSSGEDFLEDSELLHELVFLDVELPGIDGTETAERLRRENRNAVLVFISGVRNPTPESFKVTPYRYLLKQFGAEEMETELRTIVAETERIFCDAYLPCVRDRTKVTVRLADILYLSNARNGCEVHVYPGSCGAQEGKFFTQVKLRELYRRLESSDFVNVHNSYIVNMRGVESFTRKELTLKDGTVLTVSRSRYGEFENCMFEYWGRKYER